MKRTAVILLLALVAFPVWLRGQNRYADSLLHIIGTKRPTDRERAMLYADIAESYSSHDMSNTLKYGMLGLEAAQRCGDKELVFRFYNYIGMVYTYRCSYDTAKVYLDLQITAAHVSGNPKLVQKAYQAEGNLYARQGQFILAIESYLKVLKHFDGDESSRDYILAHGNIGECYRRLDNPRRALGYLEQERTLAERYGERTATGQAYRELGYVHLVLGDADKALEYMLRVKPKGKDVPVMHADLYEALINSKTLSSAMCRLNIRVWRIRKNVCASAGNITTWKKWDTIRTTIPCSRCSATGRSATISKKKSSVGHGNISSIVCISIRNNST